MAEASSGSGKLYAAGPASRPVLSTKVGRVLDPVAKGEEGDFAYADPLPFRPRFDYSRDGVRRGLEGSLKRLGVDRVDVALIHDIGRLTHGDAHPKLLRQVLDEALPALHDARSEGLIRWIGHRRERMRGVS